MSPRLLLLLAALVALVRADILWDTCEGMADHPSIVEGNYYNLCIQDHEFTDEQHAWTFTRTSISDTVFDSCIFENNDQKTSNFTEATWQRVEFKDCQFGSFNSEPMVFDNTALDNVHFIGCTFHSSVDIVFKNFAFNNVTFTGCKFESDTRFELGVMQQVTFDDCSFKRSDSATTVSGNDAIRFRQITLRDMTVVDSDYVTPIRFEAVTAADLHFNKSVINQFWCHSPPEGQQNDIEFRSAFNDTAFQQVVFEDEVFCSGTNHNGLFMGNVTFHHNADFSESNILDLYWDEVKMTTSDGTCRTLDMSKTNIKRRVLANTTIDCKADFSESSFETVFVRNFVATNPDFTDAIFNEQEFIDGSCCSIACVKLECLCNVSDPSGICPAGNREVNLTAPTGCFPADATMSRYDGSVVRMEDIEFAEKVAIGKGQHSEIFFFGHRSSQQSAEFVSIRHPGSTTPIRISPEHYLYVNGQLRVAASVRRGDRLRSAAGSDDVFVLEVNRETLRGVYAPTSVHGDLLVDGVVTSSYTDAMHPDVAHKMLYPLRLLYRYGFKSLVSRVQLLHEKSYIGVARALGVARGPRAIAH